MNREEACQRLDSLPKTTVEWNGYDIEPPSEGVISAIKEILPQVPDELLPRMGVLSSAEGGAVLVFMDKPEKNKKWRYADIQFFNDGSIAAMIKHESRSMLDIWDVQPWGIFSAHPVSSMSETFDRIKILFGSNLD